MKRTIRSSKPESAVSEARSGTVMDISPNEDQSGINFNFGSAATPTNIVMHQDGNVSNHINSGVTCLVNVFQFNNGSQPGPELTKFLQSFRGTTEDSEPKERVVVVQNRTMPNQALEQESRISVRESLSLESIPSASETIPKRSKLDPEGPYGFVEEGPNDESIPGQRFALQVKLPAVFEGKSQFQHIQIFDTKAHGRALVLDGVVQFTEADEFAYHEMLVHVPLLTENVGRLDNKRVLLVGAGDGGALREICKHGSVAAVTHVEIDGMVVDSCRKFCPDISSGAFESDKLTLFITDGFDFLKNDTSAPYDVAIVDSSDPAQGPNQSLFQDDFYQLLKNRIHPQHGVLCFQAEHQWLHRGLVKMLYDRCRNIFPVVRYYYTQVPTYPGGQIGFFICANDPSFDPTSIIDRMPHFVRDLQYYSREMHQAAFALPAFVQRYLDV